MSSFKGLVLICIGFFLIIAGFRGWNIPVTRDAWFCPSICNKTVNNIILVILGVLCIIATIENIR